jgi:hypothetical protein
MRKGPEKSGPFLIYRFVITYREYLLLELENVDLQHASPETIYTYAEKLGGRIPEAEWILLKDPYWAYLYARKIIQDRWPEVEKLVIKMDTYDTASNEWWNYWNFLRKKYHRWGLLKLGINKNTLDYLNMIGMNKDMQEEVIRQRPDLIGEIEDLNLELKAKFKHEKELGNVDL